MKTLLVEDDPANQLLLAHHLTRRGHQVVCCPTAELAWDRIQTGKFELLVLDWMLPGMDGLELCRRIRLSDDLDQPVILVVTACDSVGDLQAVLAAGADDYLAKPVVADLFNVRLAVAEQRVREIAERRQAEDALRRHHDYVNNILRSMIDSLVVTSPDGVIRSANAATCQLLGYEESELVGERVGKLFTEDDLFGRGAWPDDLVRQNVIRNIELNYVAKDGKQIPVLFSASMLHDRQGVMEGFVCVALDIREQKRSDEIRRGLERQLQHAQKMESLGLLAGGIAHDFNNILQGILGHASLALLDIVGDSPVYESVSKIETAAMRAADLTRQMLTYSGKTALSMKPVDLTRLAEEVMDLLKVAISKKAVLNPQLARNLPPVKADAAQLRQVLMNLITNASDALGAAGGMVKITTGLMRAGGGYLSKTFVNTPLPAGNYVFLEVADDGCGMDEMTKGKIFDPFFSTKKHGRGLGLATVLGIVRGHHGAIRVDSTVGRGTVIRVLLPCSEVGEEAPMTIPAPASQMRGAGAILVVDDEENIRAIVRRTLERVGFSVLEAVDGKEGAEIFAQHDEIIAVILDMTMPRMNGEETLREIRRLRPDIPVILSSGYTQEQTFERFREKGYSGFLKKPYPPGNLVESLFAILETASP